VKVGETCFYLLDLIDALDWLFKYFACWIFLQYWRH